MTTRRQLLASTASLVAAAALPQIGRAATPPTGKPVVKIGFLDSFSGVFSDIAAYHKVGANLALEDINRNSRVRFEFAYGDDNSKPADATTEARRLVQQENVDVLFGGTGSASGLALIPVANQLGIFNMALGPFDSSITGAKAGKYTFRFGPNGRMAFKPILNRALALGKKWYFIQADYAFGKDGYAQLSAALKASGGSEVGLDVVKLGTADFSSSLTKVRNSDADVLVLCNSGLDAANTARQFVEFGLNKKMKLVGIALEDIYYKSVPLDGIVGATFPVYWTPKASPSAAKLAQRIHSAINAPVSERHYYGYAGLQALTDRILAAGSTNADKLVAAFNDHTFESYKASKSTFRACTHQNVQDMYAGSVVSSATFAKTQSMYDIVNETPANETDGTCDSPWARDARAAIASQQTTVREGYTPKTF